MNCESTIRKNEWILLIKELIHESRIELKSYLFTESWIDDLQFLKNYDVPKLDSIGDSAFGHCIRIGQQSQTSLVQSPASKPLHIFLYMLQSAVNAACQRDIVGSAAAFYPILKEPVGEEG